MKSKPEAQPAPLEDGIISYPCYMIRAFGHNPVAVGMTIIAAWNAATETLGDDVETLRRQGYHEVEAVAVLRTNLARAIDPVIDGRNSDE